MVDQPFWIREVRERIIDHDAVELPVKLHRFYIAADQLHRFLRKFLLCNANHFRRNINAGHTADRSLQIIRDQHARSTGNVQHIDTGADAGVVQNCLNNRFVTDHIGIPFRGTAVKKSDHISFIHGVGSPVLFCLGYLAGIRPARVSANTIVGMTSSCKTVPGSVCTK